MKVIFRDLNPLVVQAVGEVFPEWGVQRGHIFGAGTQEADVLVSPSNCTGRMDGGIEQVFVNRFGWQLQTRLMAEIVEYYAGRLPIGQAHLIKTHLDHRNDPLLWMISAPTMDWPPGDVSDTDNAYLAFRGALEILTTDMKDELGREPIVLMSGLATTTGCMSGSQCAQQLLRAWEEFF